MVMCHEPSCLPFYWPKMILWGGAHFILLWNLGLLQHSVDEFPLTFIRICCWCILWRVEIVPFLNVCIQLIKYSFKFLLRVPFPFPIFLYCLYFLLHMLLLVPLAAERTNLPLKVEVIGSLPTCKTFYSCLQLIWLRNRESAKKQLLPLSSIMPRMVHISNGSYRYSCFPS